MATIFVADRSLSNPLPNTPRVLFPGAILASDSLTGDGTKTIADQARVADRYAGGDALAWIGDGAKFTPKPNGVEFTAVAPNQNAYRLGFAEVFRDVEISVVIAALQTPSASRGNFGYIDLRRQGGITAGGAAYRVRYTPGRLDTDSSVVARLVNAAGSHLSDAFDFKEGDRLGIRAKGTTVSLLINDVVMQSVQDTEVTSAGMVNLGGGNTQSGLRLRDVIVKAV